jgi:hypothetical protein
MNSATLMETGFVEWFPLKTLTFSNLPPDEGSVIVIVDKELSGKAESDILYIGRTKKPAKRIIGGYLAGYGGKNTRKINRMLFGEGYIENASISWILTDKPRIMQRELLAKFKEEHGKLPIWNSKKRLPAAPKKTPPAKSKAAPTRAKRGRRAKLGPKPKSVPRKRSLAKAETSAKTEMASKGETATEEAEKAKTENETASDSEMPT